MCKGERVENLGPLGTGGPLPRNHHCVKGALKDSISCGSALQRFVGIKESGLVSVSLLPKTPPMY